MITYEKLNEMISFIACAKDIVVVLVTNVRTETSNFTDYTPMSVTSEFMSHRQLEYFERALWDLEVETKAYFDELDFIKDVSINGSKVNGRKILVINTAQKGTAIGRKSLIPAFCDQNGIYRAGSNAFVVSLCRSKMHSSWILRSHGIHTPRSWIYDRRSGWLLNSRPEKGVKVIVKLNYEASSIGLTVKNVFQYTGQKDAFIHTMSTEYGQAVIVEEFIAGFEVELAIFRQKWDATTLAVEPVGIMIKNTPLLGSV